jgi:hypothetical protein
VGYTFWQRDTDVPPAAELTFFTGMGPRSPEPIWLSAVGVHPAPDAIYREFEHGLVLGNPAPHGYCFDLARLLPGRKFRRLRGSAEQDPTTNNGSAVDGPVTPGPKDGLFLIRQ